MSENINEKLEEFERYIIGKKVAIIGLGVSNIPLLEKQKLLYLIKEKRKV